MFVLFWSMHRWCSFRLHFSKIYVNHLIMCRFECSAVSGLRRIDYSCGKKVGANFGTDVVKGNRFWLCSSMRASSENWLLWRKEIVGKGWDYGFLCRVGLALLKLVSLLRYLVGTYSSLSWNIWFICGSCLKMFESSVAINFAEVSTVI